MVALQI